jgi:TonB family protein
LSSTFFNIEETMANLPQIRSTQSGEEVAMELDDTQTLRALTSEGHLPPLVILSRDAMLVDIVRKAAPSGMAIRDASGLDEIVDKLPAMEPGVLLVDAAGTSDIASMLAQLSQHFPEMVVVVAGKREDSGALLRLTAEGRVFRFLLTPLSHGQTRLALKAAAAQHIDLKASSARRNVAVDTATSKRNYVATYGALAVGLIIAIASVWYGVGRLTEEPQAPVAQPSSTATTPASSLPERLDPVSAELALAKEAFDAGRYLEPRGESALDFYRNALAIDPNSAAAKAGVRSVADKILERAETALTGERIEEAVRSVETARDIDSTHPRLAFLDVQIGRERERIKLTQARGVDQRVRTLVAQASEHLREGRLISPATGNARAALLEARKLDPTEPAVTQGVRDLGMRLAEEARQSLGAGKQREAQTFVDAARQLGFAGAALASVERQLADTSRVSASLPSPSPEAPSRPTPQPAVNAGPNVEAMIADLRQRIAENNLIEPTGASAQDALKALRSAAPNRAEVAELSRALTVRLVEEGQRATNDKSFERAAQLLSAAREIGNEGAGDSIAAAEMDLEAARQQGAAEPMQAARLKRTREVAAFYPRQALLSGIEGWVDLDFTISPQGIPGDVTVRGSKPRRTFDRAAIEALRQWRFEPIVRDGAPVEQRATLRMIFKPQ